MRDIMPERVTKETDDRRISNGIRRMMDYYDDIGAEYPVWLTVAYVDLPRYSEDKDIEYHIFIESDEDSTPIWIIENLTCRWNNQYVKNYYFETKEDAMAFKLRWL